jgi:hypothetical protein
VAQANENNKTTAPSLYKDQNAKKSAKVEDDDNDDPPHHSISPGLSRCLIIPSLSNEHKSLTASFVDRKDVKGKEEEVMTAEHYRCFYDGTGFGRVSSSISPSSPG